MRRRGATAALLLVAALLAPSPAAAAPGAEVGMEDERLLLNGGEDAARAVAEWAALGVDIVRMHARWNEIAPIGRERPPGLNPADPADPAYRWARLDAAVALVRAAGMRVMLTVTGPGPIWTSRAPRRGLGRWKPDPGEFAAFARAVATRFAASVDRYLIWNEPNLSGWLEPQWECMRVRPGAALAPNHVRRSPRTACTPASPRLYRELVRAAGPAIEEADPGAEIVIGEMAPVARRPPGSRGQIAPLLWLRALGCVDERGRRVRSGLCRGFQPAAADAFGYHPHSILRAPDERNPNRDEAQMGDLARLTRALDRVTAADGIRAPGGRLGIHLTEFGYQTAPPDNVIGITLATHARWLQQAAYLAWRTPRVLGLTQYQWEDEPVLSRGPGRQAYSGWQSGLRMIDGSAKPALAAFAQPFALEVSARGAVRAWGQARPGAEHLVTVLRRSVGDSEFAPLASVPTSAAGYFTALVEARAGDTLRFAWDDAGQARLSGEATVPRRGGRPRVVAAGAP